MKKNEFELKVEKAKTILDKLMQPDITLSDSMKFYKEGMKVLNDASKILENAKLEFETITKDSKID